MDVHECEGRGKCQRQDSHYSRLCLGIDTTTYDNKATALLRNDSSTTQTLFSVKLDVDALHRESATNDDNIDVVTELLRLKEKAEVLGEAALVSVYARLDDLATAVLCVDASSDLTPAARVALQGVFDLFADRHLVQTALGGGYGDLEESMSELTAALRAATKGNKLSSISTLARELQELIDSFGCKQGKHALFRAFRRLSKHAPRLYSLLARLLGASFAEDEEEGGDITIPATAAAVAQHDRATVAASMRAGGVSRADRERLLTALNIQHHHSSDDLLRSSDTDAVLADSVNVAVEEEAQLQDETAMGGPGTAATDVLKFVGLTVDSQSVPKATHYTDSVKEAFKLGPTIVALFRAAAQLANGPTVEEVAELVIGVLRLRTKLHLLYLKCPRFTDDANLTSKSAARGYYWRASVSKGYAYLGE